MADTSLKAFSRPGYFDSLEEPDNKKKYDRLPSWQRQLIRRIMEHGDLRRAVDEAGVSKHMDVTGLALPEDTVVQALDRGGVTAELIAAHLAECLDANTYKYDAGSQPEKQVDMSLKLRTIELILKIRGDLAGGKSHKSDKAIEELFEDTAVE